MSAADKEAWHHTSPLAVVFYLGKIYQDIAKNLVPSVAPLAAFLFASQGSLAYKLVFGVSAFFLVTVTGAVLRYWFFRFQITENSVLIREGVLRKSQLDIKFDRIQGVATQQNIVFRYFGLVTIKLDTAGTAQQEGNLPAVKIVFADALKERIRQENRAGKPDVDAIADANEDAQSESPKRTLLTLGPFDMVKIGLSSNRVLIFLIFLSPIIEHFDKDVADSVDDGTVQAAVDGAQAGVASGLGFALMILIGFLLFLVLASIIGAYLSYHRFELVADDQVLRSSGGLLTRHEYAVNFAKIQSVVINQNFVLRIFRRFRLRAKQASSSKNSAGKSFVVPLCERDDLPVLTHEFFGDEFPGVTLNPTDNDFQLIDKRYVRSRVVLTGVLPATVVTALMAIPLGWPASIFLLWIPVNGLIVWRRYRRFGVLVTPDGMAVRRGFIGYRVTSFLHRKIQRISVTQTITQRRKGLATLRFFLASGSVKVPYIDVNQANDLRDFALYKIESSTLAWH